MSQSSIIGAVEIGTSKVVVLAAEIVDGRSLNLIGMGEATSSGVRKGEIVDIKEVNNCTHAALLGAEKSAGVEIRQAYLAQSGSHVHGVFNTAAVNISASDNRVRRSDINRVIADVKGKQLPEHRVYLHHVRNHFKLDGRMLADPEGEAGQKLEVSYWSVDVDEKKLRSAVHAINGFDIGVPDAILSSMASGMASLTAAEMQAGALVIDIGAGATDWALYQHGAVRKAGVVAVGGDHLDNDLALGLRLNLKRAEQLKLRFGKLLVEKENRTESVWLVGDQMIGDRPIQRLAIIQILRARMEEIFMLVRKQVGEFATAEHLPLGIVLTGGTSRLAQSAELAAEVFGLPVRYGEIDGRVPRDLRDPRFATVLGLMDYALREAQNEAAMAARNQKAGILNRFVRLFGT